jgi:hypothetical protein
MDLLDSTMVGGNRTIRILGVALTANYWIGDLDLDRATSSDIARGRRWPPLTRNSPCFRLNPREHPRGDDCVRRRTTCSDAGSRLSR